MSARYLTLNITPELAGLALAHPITGERLAFDAPLPADMRALIEKEEHP